VEPVLGGLPRAYRLDQRLQARYKGLGHTCAAFLGISNVCILSMDGSCTDTDLANLFSDLVLVSRDSSLTDAGCSRAATDPRQHAQQGARRLQGHGRAACRPPPRPPLGTRVTNIALDFILASGPYSCCRRELQVRSGAVLVCTLPCVGRVYQIFQI
jgi:hypothetical protein